MMILNNKKLKIFKIKFINNTYKFKTMKKKYSNILIWVNNNLLYLNHNQQKLSKQTRILPIKFYKIKIKVRAILLLKKIKIKKILYNHKET